MPRRAQHLTQMQVAVDALHRNPVVVDGFRGLLKYRLGSER